MDNNTPNTEQMFADENHDFIKLFNGNANFNDETEIHNDLPYPTDDTYTVVCITPQMKLLKRSEMKITNYQYFL